MSYKTRKSICTPAQPGKKRKRKREIAVNCEFSPLGGCGSDNKNYSSERPDFGDMVPVWYWSNYYKAIEWRQKHKVALWKSYALALQQENKFLMAQLRNVRQTRILDTPITNYNLNEIDNYVGFSYEQSSSIKNERPKVGSITNDDVTFEMSEEMIKFFEQSIRHKLEMKKLEELKKGEEIVKELTKLQDADRERDKEMKMLYGDGNSMIIAMETAVQLSYEKYCDMKSPNYWPNIPFNL